MGISHTTFDVWLESDSVWTKTFPWTGWEHSVKRHREKTPSCSTTSPREFVPLAAVCLKWTQIWSVSKRSVSRQLEDSNLILCVCKKSPPTRLVFQGSPATLHIAKRFILMKLLMIRSVHWFEVSNQPRGRSNWRFLLVNSALVVSVEKSRPALVLFVSVVMLLTTNVKRAA